MINNINMKRLLLSVILVLSIGLFIVHINQNQMYIYDEIKKPNLAISITLFLFIWNSIYILMGIALYYIWESEESIKEDLFWLFIIQLSVHVAWFFVFFNLRLYFLSFLFLIVLWMFVFVLAASLLQVKRFVAYLQIPYVIWVSYALYLNALIWIMNI